MSTATRTLVALAFWPLIMNAANSQPSFASQELPLLPRAIAGQFVGVHDGQLIVAGGSSWASPPWVGGKKIFVDEIHVLKPGGKSWRTAGRLPAALGYGAAISTNRGVICAGGQMADTVSSSVYLLSWNTGRLDVSLLADLPHPAVNLVGAVVGNSVYVAGGQGSLSATER